MRDSVAGSIDRICALAGVTWKEALRQRFFSVLLLLGVGVVASALFFREFNFGSSELKFVGDFGFGGLTVFGSVLAIVGTSQLFFGDIESRTVTTVLAKPVGRCEFVFGKYLGVLAMLMCYVAGLGAAICAVMWWREQTLLGAAVSGSDLAGDLVSYAGLVVSIALHGVKFALLAAFTLLIASYARSNLFTVMSGFVVLIICHLQPLAQNVWARSESLMAKLAGGLLSVIFPNFQLLDLGGAVTFTSIPPLGEVAVVMAYGVGYLLVVTGLAAFSFSRREL